jgi:DNA-binding protein HU-beta
MNPSFHCERSGWFLTYSVFLQEVLAGKKLTLSGFGTFSLKQRAARKGRNPKTGEEMSLPASKAMGFSPSKGLKELMKGSVDK